MKIREADRLECEAWNAIMWAGGPAMPSPGDPQAEPTIGKAINGGYAFTTEHGPFGGLVMSNWQFSAKVRKFVNTAEQFTYPVRNGVINRGQRACHISRGRHKISSASLQDSCIASWHMSKQKISPEDLLD